MYHTGYNEKNRDIRAWLDSQRQSPRQGHGERSWVEISDDEEAMAQVPSVFQSSGSKPHHTPPLDLSVFEKGPRQAESPLDLSVKTRKRCADSTDFDELHRRRGVSHGSVLSKRMCMSQIAEQRRLSNYPAKIQPEGYIATLPQANPSVSKYHYLPSNASPLTQSSHQQVGQNYQGVQGYPSPSGLVSAGQARQPQLGQYHPSRPRQIEGSRSYDPSQISNRSQANVLVNRRSSEELKQLQKSETTALQGFYEPSGKHTLTVNATNPDLTHSKRATPVEQQVVMAPGQPHYQETLRRNELQQQRLNPNVQTSPYQTVQGRQVVISHDSGRHMQQQQQQQQKQLLQSRKQIQQTGIDQPSPLGPDSQLYHPYLSPQATAMQKVEVAAMQQKAADHERVTQMIAANNISMSMLAGIPHLESSTKHIRANPESIIATNPQLTFHQPSVRSTSELRSNQSANMADRNRNYVQGSAYTGQTIRNAPVVDSNFTVRQSYSKPEQVDYPGYGSSKLTAQQGMRQSVHRNIVSPGSSHISGGNAALRHDARPEAQRTMLAHSSQSVIQRQMVNVDARNIQDRTAVLSMAASAGRTYQPAAMYERSTNERRMPVSSTHSPRYNIEHKDTRQLSSSKEQSFVGKTPHPETNAPKSRQLAFHTSRGGREISLVGDSQEMMPVRSDIADSNIHYDSTERRLSRQHRPSYSQQMSQGSVTQENHNVSMSRRSSISSQSSRKSVGHEKEIPDQSSINIPKSSSVTNKPPISEMNKNASKKNNDSESLNLRLASEMVIPLAEKYGVERSITKGTSGLQKEHKGMDFISTLLMEELKRDAEPPEDCFKNRSLLQEIDRSANSSPLKTESQEMEVNTKVENFKELVSEFKEPSMSTSASSKSETTSYTLPLQIAIPGSKPTNRGSVIASCQSEKTPKMWSRKHMILSQFKHDEDLKNTVNIDINEKLPVESAKYVPKKGVDKGQSESLSACPPSPKMPILSPQEKQRTATLVSSAPVEPPNLVENSVNTQSQSEQTPAKEIKSLEQHLHKLISDAVKSQGSFDKEKVCETVYRLTAQPQPHKPFITRQLSASKNIPVANVAPFVHGKFASNEFKLSETGESLLEQKSEMDETKTDTLETNEEEKKAIETDLIDDLERSTSMGKYSSFESPNHQDVICNFVNVDNENRFKASDIDLDNSNSNSSFTTQNFSNLFDDDSSAQRMSPGMKKLMLNRHRSNKDSDSFKDENSIGFLSNLPKVSLSPKQEVRNVFGTFDEILLDHRIASDDDDEEEASRLSKLDSTAGYDGDDEGKKDKQLKAKTKQSSTRQKADKLVKKARLSKNLKSDGARNTAKSRLQRKNLMQKGFVDFMPEVLPQRTRTGRRARSSLRSGKELKVKVSERRRSSSQGIVRGKKKISVERRSNSLGRALELKKKSKLPIQSDDIPLEKDTFTYFSDNNDLDIETGSESLKRGKGDKGKWRIKDASSSVKQTLRSGRSKGGLMVKLSLRALQQEDDESTDEEYFQNYESEFKTFASDSEIKSEEKKEQKKSANKKKKGFHFKQKYIFQRKRRPKGRGRGLSRIDSSFVRPHQPDLDELYSFHEEGFDLNPYPSGSSLEYDPASQIPVPVEVKRVTVNKDTGETLLHRAARMGYVEVVLYCLATGNVDVNARDNAGYTPLHECCVRGHRPIAIQLLKYGADVNCVSVDGIRPIHDAVENDRLEMVRLLFSYGADPTLSTYAGRTPLKIARSERMRQTLLCYIADLNGYIPELDVEEKPWQFHSSSLSLEPPEEEGSAIFYDLPSDPEDETQDLCTLSAQPLFPTQRITAEGGKRVEDYILLEDVLRGYRVSKKDIDSQGVPSHMIKTLTKQSFMDSKKDSIFREYFDSKPEDIGLKAIRCVDAAQIIHKIEKHIASTHGSHRTKS